MKAAITLLVVVCIVSSLTGTAQGSDYQTGKILAVEKLPAAASSMSGTDAPLTADVDRYNLSIQMGDTVYICRAKVPGWIDLDWIQGKEIQGKVDSKVMSIKRANGKVTKLSILSSKKND